MTITQPAQRRTEASASIRVEQQQECQQLQLKQQQQQQQRLQVQVKSPEKLLQTQAKCQSEPAKVCSGQVDSFDHVTFWVGNAKQSAVFYMTQFGFKPFAFRGLETGSRDVACHVVRLNETIIQFVSSVEPNNKLLNDFLLSHGDAVKDVAFRVSNLEALLEHALEQGAELVHPLEVIAFNEDDADANKTTCSASLSSSCLSASSSSSSSRQTSSIEDQNKAKSEDNKLRKLIVKRATIRTFGDVTHTFIERNYEYDELAKFLPGYHKPSLELAPAFGSLPAMKILSADHIVGQFPPNQLNEITDWYNRVLNFKRYWSVDEKLIFTEHSGVKSHVVANHNERVKMPLCEVTLSKAAKNKAEEFVRYNDGSGIHHIALLTDDICSVVENMRQRGMDFLNTPDAYYDQLKERLRDCPVIIQQDIERLRKLKILVDFDEQGYLLQIFTRPVQDRPTLVFEFIQRFNHDGFGAGNFLALFKAIEAETALRGNL